MIPFTGNRTSVGVIATPERMAAMPGGDTDKFWQLMSEQALVSGMLSDAQEILPVNAIEGYSCNVSRMSSHNFALLGNAGEFLDPVFSSGVTVAMKSAELVVAPLLRQLAGEQVDWAEEYDAPLALGCQLFPRFC